MKLNELKPKEGSKKRKMRVGRGIGSGKGKTSGKGVKGQKARSGVSVKGFEGGQTPLDRRLPKFGFNNKNFRTHYAELTLERLQDAIDAGYLDAKKPIDEKTLVEARVVRRPRDGIKLLGKGELKAKVKLTVSKATKSAAEAVQKSGGSIDYIIREIKPVVNKKRAAAPKA